MARPPDYDRDLFLAGRALVVLAAARARRQLEPVDPERLNAEFAAHEPHRSAGASTLDLFHVDDRVSDGRSR